ncbi:MAG: response regulator [Gammaproteobacteria bacterium]|nr:response regulator [Gammaproteobacteria bacterium]
MGKVSLHARLIDNQGDLSWIEFTVRDNGIGIEEGALDRLFQPFEQADKETIKRYGGTGLGLVITQALVEMMGGKISVESRLGDGSLFTVRVPFKCLDKSPTGKTSLLNEVDCIIVDSEEGVSDEYGGYLQYAGAQIHYAKNIEDVKAVLQTDYDFSEPTCLLLLGEPTGYSSKEVLTELIKNLHSTNIQTLMVSRCSDGRDRCKEPQRLSEQLVVIDLEVLNRRGFLHAVAETVGRLEEASHVIEQKEYPLSAKRLVEGKASREQLILLAEDNEINQDVIIRQLGLIGYKGEVASDGIEALKMYESGNYDLLLTDLHMPKMDGYSLTRAIRSIEKESGEQRIPIIAITANALKDEEENCLSTGMDGYLSKPVELKQMQTELKKWL